MRNDALPMTGLVDVAICTYRRLSLAATLGSIARQALPSGLSIRIIVADNDDTPSAKVVVEEEAGRLGLDWVYVHAPQRNISVARNACLDAGSAPLLAFIDDDEIATPGWIAALIGRMDVTGADAVLGPARAIYPAGTRAWMKRADMHSTTPPITGTGDIRTGYSCNVLLRRNSFGALRFDPALGRSGGEDDVFFATAVRRGVRIAYAPDAVVDDPVPPTRARLAWLCRRAFRNGQTHARNMLDGGASRPIALLTAMAKAAALGIGALAMAPSPMRAARLLVRTMLHIGACARYLGMGDLQLY